MDISTPEGEMYCSVMQQHIKEKCRPLCSFFLTALYKAINDVPCLNFYCLIHPMLSWLSLWPFLASLMFMDVCYQRISWPLLWAST